jgi:transcriptional regulator with XRE-family HTH domain
MRTHRPISALPIPVRHALQKLGNDLRDARKRRRIPMALAAERATISRTTLAKIERGDPGVAISLYASLMFVLGMVDRLGGLADSASDAVGLQLDEERLPKRIRLGGNRTGRGG